MNNEIFVDINDNIIHDIKQQYCVSNYGKVINKNTNKCIGSYINREKRYKCSLVLNNSKTKFIDTARLIYKAFNINENIDNKIIMFKDNNPCNLNLCNLYSINKNELTKISIQNNYKSYNNLSNNDISKAQYHINTDKYMIYYLDEIWIDITENEIHGIKPYYKISNYGRVYNKIYNCLVHPQISYNGYMYFVAIGYDKQIHVSIHRTEMKCFKPLKDYTNMEVNHIDTNTFNNSLCNLEWLYCTDNNKYVPDNIINKDIFNQKFSNQQVEIICNMLQKNMSYQEICFYGLNCKYTGTIHKRLSDIHRRITYTNISNNYIF